MSDEFEKQIAKLIVFTQQAEQDASQAHFQKRAVTGLAERDLIKQEIIQGYNNLRAELAKVNSDLNFAQADEQLARMEREDAQAELAAANQQRDTLYSALQWIVSGMAGKRKTEIKDYANHILDMTDCEETK